MSRSHTRRTGSESSGSTRSRAKSKGRAGNRSMGALLRQMRGLRDARPGEGGLSVRPPDDHFEKEAHRRDHGGRGSRGATPPRFSAAPGRASGGRALDVDTSRAIQRSRGGGSRLPDRIRRRLEPEMGVDLSPIRIRSDSRAHALTRAVGARAMTVGRTIFIGESGFSAETRSGRETLRHEVTHALQQSGVRRVPGRKRRQMGQPSAPVVQCLMTSDQLRSFGGSAGASIKGKKRYQKILDKLDAYHRTSSTVVKKRRLGRVEQLVDDFIAANSSTLDAVKQRKLRAVRDLKNQVLFEKGEREETSSFEAKIQERARVHGRGMGAIPTSVKDTQYKFTMHSHIGHKRYTAFAKERAALRRNNMLKLKKYRKSNNEMKRQAATSVADRFTSDWLVETDSKSEQQLKRRAFIDTLIRSSGDVGHAWVSFHTVDKDGEQSEPLSFGFWPLVATTGFGVDTPGNVKHPDNEYDGRGNTRKRTETVSYRRWKQGLEAAYTVLKNPPMYELTGTNCTTFTRDIAGEVGVSFPYAFWVAPNLSWVWNPNDLYDTFED